MKTSVRCVIVVIAICSWIATSNHCAFAAVAREASGPAQTTCPFHSKPAKQKEQSAQVQCCKILRAVVFAQSKRWAPDEAKSLDVDARYNDFLPITLQRNTQRPLCLDTGPPAAHSFAELILQRSLFAHAP